MKQYREHSTFPICFMLLLALKFSHISVNGTLCPNMKPHKRIFYDCEQERFYWVVPYTRFCILGLYGLRDLKILLVCVMGTLNSLSFHCLLMKKGYPCSSTS